MTATFKTMHHNERMLHIENLRRALAYDDRLNFCPSLIEKAWIVNQECEVSLPSCWNEQDELGGKACVVEHLAYLQIFKITVFLFTIKSGPNDDASIHVDFEFTDMSCVGEAGNEFSNFSIFDRNRDASVHLMAIVEPTSRYDISVSLCVTDLLDRFPRDVEPLLLRVVSIVDLIGALIQLQQKNRLKGNADG